MNLSPVADAFVQTFLDVPKRQRGGLPTGSEAQSAIGYLHDCVAKFVSLDVGNDVLSNIIAFRSQLLKTVA